MLSIHHSNSLKKLTETLLLQLQGSRSSVLDPEHILVQNPGMKRWLQQQISLSQGIAANLRFPLPSRFIWDIFLTQFDDVETLSAYDGEVLRWQLMFVLQQHIDDPQLTLLKSYLANDDKALSRFQLAEKLAGLYDQYLVYRPKMIQNWEQGKPIKSSTEVWQAYLWSLIRQQNHKPHRADLILKLINHLSSDKIDRTKLPDRLFVFAISAMSPLYLNVLAALGSNIDVHIFNLNPCEHYWGDIQSKKERVRLGDKPLSENELLASLGKQGRDYIDQFYDSAFETIDNHLFEDIHPDSILNRVKYDILQLSLDPPETEFVEDDSIQVVSCYSELRELQVLHDRLLKMLAANHSLQPHDIVVMCPDINTLAPYVEAVFGQQDDNKTIPFSISDHNELSSSPLLQAILDWIRLPVSRLTANEILSWLELPALQRKYGLNETSVETIRYWIINNHIHWGLDQQHKQKLGLAEAADSLNTWLHGLSRLLTAYIMNAGVELFHNRVASETVMSQADYQSLGHLQKFLDDLSDWSKRLSQAVELQQWQHNVNELIDTFLQLDDEEEWLIKPLRDETASWQQQMTEAGFSEQLDATLIHYILQNAISQGSAHHYYLSGGINFCNLIPMRTLPFKVVCLIGMGDEHFPRQEIPLQLDLISINPQKGDRSRREDDRYMFLQSLLSAQDRLYISYVGQNKKDDSTLEPSVVVTELLDYIEQTTGFRIPVNKTALQAFSAKNFEQGSYARQWQANSKNRILEPFGQNIEQEQPDAIITLDEIIKFYKNPAKYFMEKRLNMSLSDYAESIQDDEIFTLDPLQKFSLNAKLLNELFENGKVQNRRYLNSGELAEQNIGLIQFEENYQQVNDDYQKVSTHQEFNGFTFFDGSVKLDEVEISGRVASFSQQGLLQINQSSLKGKHFFSYWIQHCFLCALESIQFCEFYNKEKIYGFPVFSVEQAKEYLQQFINGFNAGRKKALEFYVDTAFEYEKLLHSKGETIALEKIKSLWTPGDFNSFYEAEDIYLKTSLKNSSYNADNFSAEFFDNSSLYMSPVVTNMQEIKK